MLGKARAIIAPAKAADIAENEVVKRAYLKAHRTA